MLQTFLGVDSGTVSNLSEMWLAIRDVFKWFKKIFVLVQTHKTHIALAMTAVWTVVCLWPIIISTFFINIQPKR